jgi:hypothetical protein
MKKCYWIYFATISFLLGSCNLFNPSGEGTAPSSADGLIAYGQSKLDANEWDEAISAFQKAIEKDSTKSLAYYGLSKAAAFKHDLKDFALLGELEKEGNDVPFSDLDTNVATEYLQGTNIITEILGTLVERDTTPNIPMDGRIRARSVTLDYGFLSLLNTLMRIKDTNGDSVINGKDDANLVNDLLALVDGGDGVQLDSQKAESANRLLEELSNGSQDASDALSALSGSLGEDVQEQIDSNNVRFATFYKFGDQKDNDGDGCVDEELQDGLDNDGDGLVDEDSYLGSGTEPPSYLRPSTGNNRTVPNFIDPSDDSGSPVTLNSGRLVFTEGEGFWPTSRSDSLRKIIADTLSSQSPPYTLSSDLLQAAKSEIKGCWNMPPYQ